jgi:uncharacterized repeat protein (TIGR03837 family)
VDDPRALAWMAPQGARGVTVVRWADPLPGFDPGDVVIEAFGCDPPPAFVARMALRRPLWINLEYLSAEPFVQRSHGLRSPVQPYEKWFFYPGFTPTTGGLLREPQALAAAADPPWAELGQSPQSGERCVSLFAYAHAPFEALFERLDDRPTLLLIAAGASQAPALRALQGRPQGRLRAAALPWLTQRDYDRLLFACDLNFARGEDSMVRALWAGVPFVWHIYRQDDGAHRPKLEALLDRQGAAPDVRGLWRAWNGLGDWPAALPDPGPWRAACEQWRAGLLAQSDLSTRLLQFAAAKR